MKGYKGKIKKKITVKLIGDAEKAFQELNRIVGEQHSKGIASSKDITLLSAINRIFDTLENSDCAHSSLQRGASNRNFRRAQKHAPHFSAGLFLTFLPVILFTGKMQRKI